MDQKDKKGTLQVFKGDYVGVDPKDESDTVDLSKGYAENGRLTITEGLLKGREAEIVSYSIRQKRCRLLCVINGRRHFFTVSAEIEKR